MEFLDKLPGVGIGFAEQPALDIFDAAIADKFQSFAAVDHLGDGLDLHGLAQRRQRLQERAALGRALGILDRAAVKLDHVDFKHAQVLKAGGAGAEIVEAYVKALSAQARDERVGFFQVSDAGGFGDLEQQKVFQLCVGVEQLVQFFCVLSVVDRHTRNIDRQGDLVALVLAQPLDALSRYGDVELVDQPGFLGEGNPLVRRDVEVAVEAHQRFVVMDRAGTHIEDGVEGHLKIGAPTIFRNPFKEFTASLTRLFMFLAISLTLNLAPACSLKWLMV